MNTFEIIRTLCNKKGITIYRLEKECGLSVNSIMKWRAASPAATALSKIADYFEVSVDYLLGREEIKKLPDGFPTDSNFNKDLNKMGFSTAAYDLMTENEKQALITTIASLAENFSKNKK